MLESRRNRPPVGETILLVLCTFQIHHFTFSFITFIKLHKSKPTGCHIHIHNPPTSIHIVFSGCGCKWILPPAAESICIQGIVYLFISRCLAKRQFINSSNLNHSGKWITFRRKSERIQGHWLLISLCWLRVCGGKKWTQFVGNMDGRNPSRIQVQMSAMGGSHLNIFQQIIHFSSIWKSLWNQTKQPVGLLALRVLCGTGNQTHFDASTKSHEREYCANLKSTFYHSFWTVREWVLNLVGGGIDSAHMYSWTRGCNSGVPIRVGWDLQTHGPTQSKWDDSRHLSIPSPAIARFNAHHEPEVDFSVSTTRRPVRLFPWFLLFLPWTTFRSSVPLKLFSSQNHLQGIYANFVQGELRLFMFRVHVIAER